MATPRIQHYSVNLHLLDCQNTNQYTHSLVCRSQIPCVGLCSGSTEVIIGCRFNTKWNQLGKQYFSIDSFHTWWHLQEFPFLHWLDCLRSSWYWSFSLELTSLMSQASPIAGLLVLSPSVPLIVVFLVSLYVAGSLLLLTVVGFVLSLGLGSFASSGLLSPFLLLTDVILLGFPLF